MAAKNDVTGDSINSRPASNQYRSNWDNIQWGINMAEKNDPKDQEPRGENIIQLVEKQERLRQAECAAKMGEYRNGQCYR